MPFVRDLDAPDVTTLGGASPFVFPEAWDRITFGGTFTWQGKIEIRGASRYYKWQQKNAPGKKGAAQTFQATFPKPFHIKFFIWTQAQFENLPDLLQCFFYDGTKTGPGNMPLVVPLDIYHPALALIDIAAVVIDEVFAPEVDQDHSGWMTMVVKMTEFLPAVPASVTTPTATGTGTTPFTIDLNTGTPAELAKQNQAIADLKNQLANKDALP